jgi:1-acyl-sn-glycerol-3-phosphate acyltransferase
MKKITLEGLREELLKTGGYRSSPERLAKKRKAPGFFTTLGFTSSVFSVFPSCAWRELISGSMTQDQWAHYCFPPIPKAESYGVPVILDGWKERQSYEGPVIYLSNHMSTLETLLLPAVTLTYGPLSTVVKESLSHLPFLRKAAIDMKLIPIGRKSPREDLVAIFSEGAKAIQENRSVLIFPQGTRSEVFSAKKFSSIGAKLAEKTGAYVCPVAVKTDIQSTRPNGKGWFKDFGTVDTSKDIRLRAGPLLKGTAKEINKAAFDWIKAQLDEWGMPTEA